MEPNTPDARPPLAAATGGGAALSLAAWHERFLQQAGWTRNMRRRLFTGAGVAAARRVLEVGCGTGAVLSELGAFTSASICGLDLNADHLGFARRQAAGAHYTLGDAHTLPYPAGAFDLTYCHFLLLWVRDPLAVLAEMRRVTRRGGAVLALAEPDYGARIDYPPELEPLGAWQRDALQRQGADPEVGRRLASLFAHAGLPAVETGVLGGQWRGQPAPEARQLEWAVLQADLQDLVPSELLAQVRTLDDAAWRSGERVLFVPTFYAWGRAT